MENNHQNPNQNTDSKKVKKRATVRPLILTSMVFVLILALLAAPVAFKLFGVAQQKVHQLRTVFVMENGDVQPRDDYYEQCKAEGIAQEADALRVADKVGTLSCNNAAVNCDVYYGINRVSRREGAALSVQHGLFGSGGEIRIDGDVSTAFKALRHVKKGDMFTVIAADGEYVYTVQDVQVCSEYRGEPAGEYLLLTTAASDDAFGYQNAEKLTVVATLGEEDAS